MQNLYTVCKGVYKLKHLKVLNNKKIHKKGKIYHENHYGEYLSMSTNKYR